MDKPVADVECLSEIAALKRRVETIGREIVSIFVPLHCLSKFDDYGVVIGRVSTPRKKFHE